MNEIAQVNHVFHAVDAAKDKFEDIVAKNPSVNWETESMFAYQMVSKNSYILDIAKNNRESVKNAVINIAGVGLSLNPATKYAYLVPRDGAICLDISYQGLIKIATDSGSIKWAKAELVYNGDEFIYKGPAEKPEHNIPNPFDGRRGKYIADIVGVYCMAKTVDGDFLIELMTADEVFKIRDEAKSMSTPAGRKSSPWAEGNYPGEMAKKACIKRASKTWPKTEQHERIQTAVNVLNEIDGSDWAEVSHRFKPGEKVEIITQMRTALASGDSFGVLELVQEYSSTAEEDFEESSKFWALFNSSERSCINKMLDDSKVEQERLTMGNPELNEPLETSEL